MTTQHLTHRCCQIVAPHAHHVRCSPSAEDYLTLKSKTLVCHLIGALMDKARIRTSLSLKQPHQHVLISLLRTMSGGRRFMVLHVEYSPKLVWLGAENQGYTPMLYEITSQMQPVETVTSARQARSFNRDMCQIQPV